MVKVKQLPKRQRFRKALLFVSLLLFPVTLYYFSPMIILQGASEGVINASLIVFGLMLVSALFVGRLWCGWACPAGALQELGSPINNKPTPGGKFNWIKWAIWIPWIGGIAALAIRAGGYHALDPFYKLETGITMSLPLDGGGPLVYDLLHHPYPFPRSRSSLWTKGWLPHHLLDGTIHDSWTTDPEHFQVALVAPEGGA